MENLGFILPSPTVSLLHLAYFHHVGQATHPSIKFFFHVYTQTYTHTHTHRVFREFHLDNLLSIFAFLCFFPKLLFLYFFLLTLFDFPLILHLLTFTFNCSIHWLFLLALKSSAEKCK